jgi:hypothetical protein
MDWYLPLDRAYDINDESIATIEEIPINDMGNALAIFI